MAEVSLVDLIKDYSGGKHETVRAVDNISLTIEDGEFMVLVGPSGCGKSTTLRMIAGLEEITHGTVSIDQSVVNNVLPKDRNIAMVFQNYALYPHMTVFDNMAFGLKLMRYPKAEIRQRVEEAAAILGIQDLMDRKPKALSGGQRQRVAVGRAIVRKPKVFLFDEPLSNLDAKMRVSMRTEISKLHSRLESTMIYVTHDQVEAMTMGDRITVMRDGVIMQVADPLTLYNNPANMFVAGFIGSPPMNFIHGALRRKVGGVSFVEGGTGAEITLSEELSNRAQGYIDRDIVLGSRPEDLGARRDGTGEQGSSVLHASIEVAEPMGAEILLYLNTGRHSLVLGWAPTAITAWAIAFNCTRIRNEFTSLIQKPEEVLLS